MLQEANQLLLLKSLKRDQFFKNHELKDINYEEGIKTFFGKEMKLIHFK